MNKRLYLFLLIIAILSVSFTSVVANQTTDDASAQVESTDNNADTSNEM